MLIAKSRIKCNGQIFEAGAELPELDDRQTTALIDAGSAEIKGDGEKVEAPKAPKAPKKVEGDKPSDRWNRAKLAEYATEHEIAFDDSATKAEILGAIQAAEGATEDDSE